MEPLFSALLFPEIIFIKFIKPGPDLSFIECSPFPDTHGHLITFRHEMVIRFNLELVREAPVRMGTW